MPTTTLTHRVFVENMCLTVIVSVSHKSDEQHVEKRLLFLLPLLVPVAIALLIAVSDR